MANNPGKMIYTYTDEAPALATHSLVPMIEPILKYAGIDIELRDISLSGRIINQYRLIGQKMLAAVFTFRLSHFSPKFLSQFSGLEETKASQFHGKDKEGHHF